MPVLESTNTDLINKKLLVQEVVHKLHHFTKLYAVETLFIAGGYCRSRYLNKLWEVNDIDVASAYEEQALQLGGIFASEELSTTPRFYQRTGTAMMEYTSEFGTIKVEFQGDSVNSYMYNQEVRDWIHNQNIEDVPLMHNIYGRDFTINSMIYSLHNGKMYDPTQRAQKDFDDEKIVSLLPPQLLIKYNPLAILRAIRFSMTYDFRIEAELSNAMKDGIEILQESLSQERIMKDMVKILKINGPQGLDMLKHYGLDRILLNPEVKDYLELESRNE